MKAKKEMIGLAGLGLLGRGIAASLLAHGFPVTVYTTGEDTHQRGAAYIDEAMNGMLEHGVTSAEMAASWRTRYTAAASLSDFGPCLFVIESVVEDLAIKRLVYDELEAVIGAEVPLVSNTSSIPITTLQDGRKHPERFLGMHWSQPAYATRFLELIRGRDTSDAALQHAARLGRELGKEPSFVQKDVPGFIVNRLAYAMYREAASLLENGVADAETIDTAFRNSIGLWANFCGPFRWIDITGGPELYAKTMSGVCPGLYNQGQPPELMLAMMRQQFRGTRNGRGFYSYEPGDDAEWERRFHEHAWEVRANQEKHFPPASSS